MNRVPEWLRSAVLTFLATFALVVLQPDFDWSQGALIAAGIAAVRTVASALLPGGSFGTSPIQGDE